MSACHWCMCVSGWSVAAAGICGKVHDDLCACAISGRCVFVSQKARRVLLLLTLHSLCVSLHIDSTALMWFDACVVPRGEGGSHQHIKHYTLLKDSHSQRKVSKKQQSLTLLFAQSTVIPVERKNEGMISRLTFSKQLPLFQPSARERPEMELQRRERQGNQPQISTNTRFMSILLCFSA